MAEEIWAGRRFEEMVEKLLRLDDLIGIEQIDDTKKVTAAYDPVEIYAYQYCRKEDAAIAEGIACQAWRENLGRNLIRSKAVKVYWRERPQYLFTQVSMITKLDENGPDITSFSKVRCRMDHAWWKFAVYGRCGFVPATTEVLPVQKQRSIMDITRMFG